MKRQNRNVQSVNKAPRRKRSSCLEALEPIRVLSVVVPLDLGSDLSDPDDELSEARSLNLSTGTAIVTGEAISLPTDVDMFSFTVAAGQRLSFDVDHIGTATDQDTVLRLFNSAGTELAYSDDAPAPGEAYGLEAYLDYTFGSA